MTAVLPGGAPPGTPAWLPLLLWLGADGQLLLWLGADGQLLLWLGADGQLLLWLGADGQLLLWLGADGQLRGRRRWPVLFGWGRWQA